MAVKPIEVATSSNNYKSIKHVNESTIYFSARVSKYFMGVGPQPIVHFHSETTQNMAPCMARARAGAPAI